MSDLAFGISVFFGVAGALITMIMTYVVALDTYADDVLHPLKFVPYYYKYIWDFLNSFLNKAGSIILLVLYQILTLTGTILMLIVAYLICCPLYYLAKLFCKIFARRD